MQPTAPNGSATLGAEPQADALGSGTSTVLDRVRKVGGRGWVFAFIAIEFACHLSLLTKELAPLRVYFRSASFAASLLFLLIVPGRAVQSKGYANIWPLIIMTVITLSALNPDGGTPLAVVAHWAMYLAVLGPLFWVARLKLSQQTHGHLMLIIWGFHVLSSVVGVLQVYYPGQFQPALTTFISEKQMLTIRLASGEWVPRPMGLTDTPGGAAGSGLVAALFGVGVLVTRPFRFAGLIGVGGMTAGLVCIYLAQVRSALVMLGICFTVLMGLFAMSGKVPRVAGALIIGAAVVIGGFEFAFGLGGETVTNRLATLVSATPTDLYRSNRGFMLEHAFNEVLPTYPLGAGLGRWGMLSLYFGTRGNELWAEIQWVAWILDGGIPLLILYPLGILAATFYAVKMSLRPSPGDTGAWAAVIAAWNVGTLAICFSYVPFMASGGLEFWLLNAALLQSSRQQLSPQ